MFLSSNFKLHSNLMLIVQWNFFTHRKFLRLHYPMTFSLCNWQNSYISGGCRSLACIGIAGWASFLKIQLKFAFEINLKCSFLLIFSLEKNLANLIMKLKVLKLIYIKKFSHFCLHFDEDNIDVLERACKNELNVH